MEKTLVIVESPAKARTLGKFLGKKYEIRASMGHVRDLPRSQFGVDVDDGFKPKYITIRGKGDAIKELRAARKKSNQVLLASDPDREGEAIAWHLQELLQIDPEEPCRVEFNEITREAVTAAIKNPRKIDPNRVDAQQARRILDRLVGYNLSPLLWRKVRKGLSAGRVQSVAVHLICAREREIEAFVSEEYWTLTALLANRERERFKARLLKKAGEKLTVPNEEAMKGILDDLKEEVYRVADVIRKEKKKNPSPPFTTSTLQQEAYRRLNFTTRKTMMVAQQLYEGLDLGKEGPVGLVTYIRTDSTRISPGAQDEAREYIAEHYGKEYVPKQKRVYTGKARAQDAHEAIRPTSVLRTPEALRKYLNPDQLRLYELIWSRFLASQMVSAVLDTVRAEIVAGEYLFRATGSTVKFPGFTRVYTELRDEAKNGEEEEEGALPALEKGEQLKLVRTTPARHFTQPPARYTEATLVRTLEELGIGRPSTYAPVVETIQRRGYVVRRGKTLHPTQLGLVVIDLLKEHFPDVINYEFTAELEEKLDRIEEGSMQWEKVLEEFYRPFRREVAEAEAKIDRVRLDEVTDEECRKCGRKMVIKMGRYGKFLACPGFPECRHTRPIFEETGHRCPKCGGRVVVRRTKKSKVFYGCAGYPGCDFVTWDQPTDQKCPDCQSFLVARGTRGHPLQRVSGSAGQSRTFACANPECGYKERKAGRGKA
ncbi:type I DNA topoisomerase [Candidatus Desulforudis audaxviator]|uniref:DNA topoisomerase 1 n=1 Tax=Desulforudis audaxviator (strain MP104C) TaxID=477974 RepID=B1I255_DESAP|nr:type I DNA topoisomerase [Candidatus Desulforudis audaxviator]ACA59134.1 DNA topoisomerase I [Candidatus Desulforudis audaxviator MP104C]AZK59202.1 DNA topoisomerase I [Candidatus Desulforudis audaxviator]